MLTTQLHHGRAAHYYVECGLTSGRNIGLVLRRKISASCSEGHTGVPGYLFLVIGTQQLTVNRYTWIGLFNCMPARKQ